MKPQISTSKFYRRWIQPHSWQIRLSKGAALLKGRFNYLPVQSLPSVNIQLPLSAHRQFWQGISKERHIFQFFIESIPAGGVFLDVGGNIGIYSTTLWIAKSGNIKICAFEPIPSTIAVLRETLVLNNVEAHIEPIALSSEDGELILSAYEHGANNYWVKNSETSNCPTISVPKIRLDNWFTQHPDRVPNAIKIDVEGHELEVLKGAKQTLQTHKPALLVECHCASWEDLGVSRTEFIELINSFGYKQIGDVHGCSINFKNQASTIHLFCYP